MKRYCLRISCLAEGGFEEDIIESQYGEWVSFNDHVEELKAVYGSCGEVAHKLELAEKRVSSLERTVTELRCKLSNYEPSLAPPRHNMPGCCA